MDIGVFQLLPRGRAATDREVVGQALWDAVRTVARAVSQGVAEGMQSANTGKRGARREAPSESR